MLVAVVVVFTLASTLSAQRARGMVVPGLLMDPFCEYSAVGLPGVAEPPLRFPDTLRAIDGAPTRCSTRDGRLPSLDVDARFGLLRTRGAREVTLDFQRGAERLRVVRPLVTVGTAAIVWFWALYFAAGLMVAWSGMTVLALSRTAAARAYGLSSMSTFFFLGAFFDYHTTRWLVPMFSAATVWLGAGCLWLAVHFPTSPAPTRVSRALSWVIVTVSSALSLALVVGPLLRVDVMPARLVASLFAPISGVVLVVSLFSRRHVADDVSRWQVRVALSGLVFTLVAIALGMLASVRLGSTRIHAIMPLVIPFTPLSVGWAIARHNVLDTDAVITRRLLVLPTWTLALGLSLAGWLVLRIQHVVELLDVLEIAISGVLFFAFIVGARRFVDRVLFPARKEFRPTIQLLSESLTGIAEREKLRTALVEVVSRWLPSRSVRVLDPDALGVIDRLPESAAAALQSGATVWTQAPSSERHLVVPMRSHDVLRGVLVIAPKRLGTLFTEDDMALLQTIAALGAIAMHNVAVVAELESTRRLELDATREDKRLTLGVLGAELSHEITHPLAFFKGILARGARRPLDQDDVEIGQEELQRMERMLSSLRRLESPSRTAAPIALEGPIARALVLVRERVAERRIRCTVDIPAGCSVLADRDGLVQVFSNLLRNAVQAAVEGGAVGVEAKVRGGALVIDVWDDGPGVPEAQVPLLFHRWVTSRAGEGGSGLGLSVARGLIVTSFNWDIEYARESGRTIFRITVPSERFVQPTADHAAAS